MSAVHFLSLHKHCTGGKISSWTGPANPHSFAWDVSIDILPLT